MSDNQDNSAQKQTQLVNQYWNDLTKLRSAPEGWYKLGKAKRLIEIVLKTFYKNSEILDENGNSSTYRHIENRRDEIPPALYRRSRAAIRERNNWEHPNAGDSLDDSTEDFVQHSTALIELAEFHLLPLLSKTGTPENESGHIAEPKSGYRLESGNPEPHPLSTPIAPPPPERDMSALNGAAEDPTISASAIAEHYFCPRAGIIANSIGYRATREKLPSLHILPMYELDRIKTDLNKSKIRIAQCLAAMVVVTVGFSLLALPYVGGNVALILLALAAYAVGFGKLVSFTYTEVKRHCILSERFSQHENAEICEPNPSNREMQEVDWWGLLKAKFEVKHSRDPIVHEVWKLSGKPDRILVRGGLRIPVFEMKVKDGRLERPQIKQIAKAVAYCRLLLNQGFDSPYAIVLSEGQYKGYTVSAYSDKNLAIFEAGVIRLRETLRSTQPPPEPTDQRCKGCRHGAAVVYFEGEEFEKNGNALTPHLLTASDNHQGRRTWLRHTACGDYFKWIPKNESCETLSEVRPS